MPQRKDVVWSALALVVLLLIAGVSGWLRAQALHTDYSHPDEEIARAVVTRVLTTKKKDTNWARTDVDKIFRYNQFNFSSYYLAAARLDKLGGHAAEAQAHPLALIGRLREQNVWFASLAVLLTGLLGWRLAAAVELRPASARGAGILATLLAASCVTLYQDSIYARPEAFVTVLTLVFVFVLLADLPTLALLALSGSLLGILIASKITFAMLLPFPLLVVVARGCARARAAPQANGRPPPSRAFGACMVLFASIGAGFGLGAPYALRAPAEYLEGLGYLLHQYNSDDWLREAHGGVSARLAHGLAYLIYTDGAVVLLLAFAGLAVLLRRGRYALVFALAGPLSTLVYFLQTRAFFERNFSHALPLLFALSGLAAAVLVEWSAARVQGASMRRFSPPTVAAAVLFLALYTPWSVSAKLHRTLVDNTMDQRIDATMRRISRDGAIPVLFGYSDIARVPGLRSGLCGSVVYKLLDFGDPLARQQLATLDAQGYRILARVDGPFDGAPYSTLQSYHAAGVVFLASPPDPPDAPCKAELVVPVADARYVAVDVSPVATGSWAQNAFPPGMSLRDWTHAFYASWNGSDANMGELSLGPFAACGELVVPYAVGPGRDGLELLIERELDGRHETILRGAPPPSLSWTAIRIPPAASCASYTIHATDHGAGYGQWLGIGIPVELRPALVPAQSSAAPAVATNSTKAAAATCPSCKKSK